MYHLQMYTILTTINDDRGYSWPVGVKLAVATSVDTKPAKTQSTVKIRIPNSQRWFVAVGELNTGQDK